MGSGLQIIAFIHPCRSRRVAGHSPISTRAQATASHLRTIGQAGTLKLLREETTEKRCQPFLYRFVSVLSSESILGQIEYFGRAEAETQGIIQEKVMQFVKENLKNRTTILVTHDPRDAKDLAAAKIIEMETEK